jgi:hypothetical protein
VGLGDRRLDLIEGKTLKNTDYIWCIAASLWDKGATINELAVIAGRHYKLQQLNKNELQNCNS